MSYVQARKNRTDNLRFRLRERTVQSLQDGKDGFIHLQSALQSFALKEGIKETKAREYFNLMRYHGYEERNTEDYESTEVKSLEGVKMFEQQKAKPDKSGDGVPRKSGKLR